MTTQEFIKQFIKVTYQEQQKCFGYHPFNMVSIMEDNALEMHAMAGLRAEECYELAIVQILKGAKITHMAMDFPVLPGSHYDRVVVFSVSKENVSITSIQYNSRTGCMFEPSEKDPCHRVLLMDLFRIFKSIGEKLKYQSE